MTSPRHMFPSPRHPARRTAPSIQPLEPRRLLSTYFVAPTGADTNPGTEAAPFATIQHAAANVRAGDTIHVRPGEYDGFVLGWDHKAAGTSSTPITFLADPGAVITAHNNKTADGINVENSSYVTIEGFTFQPTEDDARWRSGIRFGGGGTGDIARNNTVKARATDSYGIYSSFTTGLLIANNTVTGTNNSAIYTANSAVRPTIRGNTVSDATGNGLHFNGDASQGGAGVIAGATIENNTVTNAGQTGGSAINCDGVQDSTILNNTLKGNHAKGISLYKIDAAAGSTGNIIKGNTVTMASDAAGFALVIKNASTNTTIQNNTLFSPNGSINVSRDSLVGLKSDHNQLTNRLSPDDEQTILSLAGWQRQTGQDKHSTAVNNTNKRAAAIRKAIALAGQLSATSRTIIAAIALAVLTLLATAALVVRRRNLHRWLFSYARTASRRRAPRPDDSIHVLLCIADHFEPHNGKVSRQCADERLNTWLTRYPELFDRLRDSDGRPPRHTFFYPLEQYDEAHLDALANFCRRGFGEVEVHLHHDRDNSADLRLKLANYRELLAMRHGLLPRDQQTGQTKYAFVHGDWALDNSHPAGKHCGVNDELTILRETGCYADFTLPSAPAPPKPQRSIPSTTPLTILIVPAHTTRAPRSAALLNRPIHCC